MKAVLLATLRAFDRKASPYALRAFGERSGLLILLFHSLFLDRAEVEAGAVAPQQGVTVDQFRRIVDYYLEAGYAFASPDDVVAGLRPEGRHVLLTFDDGYYNNTRALPVLDALGVPALFFVSTRHVVDRKLFWWDALHREAARRGVDPETVRRYKRTLKGGRTADAEAAIRAAFGPRSLEPTSDTDRPLTPDELRDFARERRVFIGNHTADHAILTNYTLEEVRAQIRECQETLAREAGVRPVCISYPNGNHSDDIARIARAEGMLFGITGISGKNALPLVLDGLSEMKLRRMVPYGTAGDRNLIEQCAAFRSDVSLYRVVKNAGHRQVSRRAGGQRAGGST